MNDTALRRSWRDGMRHMGTREKSVGEGALRERYGNQERPQIINLPINLVADNGNRRWEQAVANSIIIMPSQHTLAQPGAHTLEIWLADSGLVLEKLVLSRGGLPASYLGPPESAVGGVPAQAVGKGSVGRR